jgi:hypothetical protein
MAKATNYVVYNSDPAFLERVYDEYVFLGRNVRRFADRVVVYAYPKAKPVKPKREERPRRDSDEEKAKVDHTQRSKRERWYE